jgi:hypothetical protein
MPTLSITDLFTPALSGVGATAAIAPPGGSWYAILLANSQALGLPTTSWEPGGPERTILALTANALAQEDGIISIMAQGGFLDYAATGTVTFTAANGQQVTQFVTPDPSIPIQNPTGVLGWLDVLASSVYQVTRLQATFAAQNVVFTNTTLASSGPHAPGTFHIGNPATGATYTNADTLTIAGGVGVTTTAPFIADARGPDGTSSVGTVTQMITTVTGVTVVNLLPFVGQNFESNTALAARCRASLASRSPNGPKGAYEYFALAAFDILQAETPPVTLRGGRITRVLSFAVPALGEVETIVANAAGVVPGVTNLDITGATNTTPIQLTVASTTGLSNGDFVTVRGVLGNTAANGTFTISNLTGTTFDLDGSVGNGGYVTSGQLNGGDLGEVDRVIQDNCVPDSVTATTISAADFPVAIVATVVVPLASVASYTTAVGLALTNYFASLPIGGIDGVLDYNDVIGVIYDAGIFNGQPSVVRHIPSLTLNGGTVNLSYSSPIDVAVMSPAAALSIYGV